MSEEEAKSKAVEYVMEREALYQEALRNGYTVTEQEVLDFLEEQKEFIQMADNKEEVMAVINQFDSEEEYWKLQKKLRV